MINKMTLYTFLTGSIIILLALKEKVLIHQFEPWPPPYYSSNNSTKDSTKIELGKLLFYDPLLSFDSTISCASCHSPYNAFAHTDHSLSHGIKDRIGKRNAPALMNLAWQPIFMWDGAIHHLDMQALAPITHPDEMGNTLEEVLKRLNASSFYQAYFYQAYKDSLITSERVLKSLSQFMLTLVSSDSKYDQVSKGVAVFSEQEEKGYILFKQHCASCHTEPLFTNHSFQNNGLIKDSELNDLGRMTITLNSLDSLKFKVPTLRNIEFTYPYMHDGRFKTLTEVLNHYTSGISSGPTLAKQFERPLPLSSNDKVDIIAFLLTLTDQNFLFNKNFTFPRTLFLNLPKDVKK